MYFMPHSDGTETIKAVFDTKEAAEDHERFAQGRFDVISSKIEQIDAGWKLTQLCRQRKV